MGQNWKGYAKRDIQFFMLPPPLLLWPALGCVRMDLWLFCGDGRGMGRKPANL